MELSKVKRKLGVDPKDLELYKFYFVVDLKEKDIKQYEFKSVKYNKCGPANTRGMNFEFVDLGTRKVVKLVDRKNSPYRYYYFTKKSKAISFLSSQLVKLINTHNNTISKLVSILSKISEEGLSF